MKNTSIHFLEEPAEVLGESLYKKGLLVSLFLPMAGGEDKNYNI